ncbi:DUF808 family protein [Shigella flexneri]
MAGSSLLTLLDDIATLLNGAVSVMGKLAAKKTAGVLGMTYRSMRNKFSGVGQRETSVVWGVAKGSLINKVILVPLALIVVRLSRGRLRHC